MEAYKGDKNKQLPCCVFQHRRDYIELPHNHEERKIQINPYCLRELQYIHLQPLIEVMKNDPDLADVPKDTIPHIIQTLFVACWSLFSAGLEKLHSWNTCSGVLV